MKANPIYEASAAEKQEAIVKIKKRRRLYHLLSLTIVLAPVTMSLALLCNNTIAGIKSSGSKSTNIMVRWGHILCSYFFAIILVPIFRHFPGTVGL